MEGSFLSFMHSLLRWLVLIGVAGAAFIAWRGVLLKLPILVWERMLTIIALTLCHVQLLVGVLLYVVNYKQMTKTYEGFNDLLRYWKYEHPGMMILAVVLVTLGRVLSKRARFERNKQLFIAVFYLLALLTMLWAIPWPFTFVGQSRGWL